MHPLQRMPCLKSYYSIPVRKFRTASEERAGPGNEASGTELAYSVHLLLHGTSETRLVSHLHATGGIEVGV